MQEKNETKNLKYANKNLEERIYDLNLEIDALQSKINEVQLKFKSTLPEVKKEKKEKKEKKDKKVFELKDEQIKILFD